MCGTQFHRKTVLTGGSALPVYRESAGLRIMKRAPVAALVVFLLTDFGLTSVIGQTTGPAPVFGPALEQIQSKTRIPILLPSKLPSAIPESGIKLASGRGEEERLLHIALLHRGWECWLCSRFRWLEVYSPRPGCA
jgi:hypothetical protein